MSEPDTAPDVSVVMVTHGAWHLTEQALAALRANTGRRFELIVVDNASQDETRGRLAKLPDAQVILNEENRGFGPANNQGARRASAEWLLLLNTDAFVHPGWLEPLLETISQEQVGAVVPQYLHADGSLQDAGVLVARDGTVRVYGDGDRPDRLRYRFRRVVDAGSAACQLIRRSAFEALGGFDERFAPAYYEDLDFAMRLARAGLSVVYEPRSTVTHVRYGSGDANRAQELSERHRRVFADRWGAELTARPATFTGTGDQAQIAARDAVAMPRLLICAAPAEPGLEPLIRLLLDVLPRARVTWATRTDRFDPDWWLAAGVELADAADHEWLDERLFHYDLVVVGEAIDSRLATALARTQPQAPRVWLNDIAGEHGRVAWPSLARALAGAGIASDASGRSIHERQLLT
jgi:GT2 family glycosyltransferase